jgi:hypothetical protein
MYRVESLHQAVQDVSRDAQRHDALVAWMRAVKLRSGVSWARDYSWYINRFKEDFPAYAIVGKFPDRRGPEVSSSTLRSTPLLILAF